MKAKYNILVLGLVATVTLGGCGGGGEPVLSEEPNVSPDTRTYPDVASVPSGRSGPQNIDRDYSANFENPVSGHNMTARVVEGTLNTHPVIEVDVLSSATSLPVVVKGFGLGAMLVNTNGSFSQGCQKSFNDQRNRLDILYSENRTPRQSALLAIYEGLLNSTLGGEAGDVWFDSELFQMTDLTVQAARRALTDRFLAGGETVDLEYAQVNVVEYEYVVTLNRFNFSEFDSVNTSQRSPQMIAARFSTGVRTSNSFICDLAFKNMEISVLKKNGTQIPVEFSNIK